MVAKAGSVLSTSAAVADLERREAVLATLAPYQDFSRRALGHRDKLSAFVRGVRREGRTVFGCGASTKGNVILQFCGFTADDIACIADVNADKFGCFTPGTGIPIVSEADARAQRPDYFLVLPWHFRDAIIAREAEHLRRGGKLVMPLPEVEVISG